jgi:hypothetical protein
MMGAVGTSDKARRFSKQEDKKKKKLIKSYLIHRRLERYGSRVFRKNQIT